MKSVPDKYKLIVYGYVHRMEAMLDSINEALTISDLVTLTIVCYYYNFIQFTKWGDGITISGEEQNILRLDDSILSAGSAFIGDPIYSMQETIIKCKIKISETTYWSYMVFFGICYGEVYDLNTVFWEDKNRFSYSIQNSGHRFKTDLDESPDNKGICTDYDGITCNSGDTLTLILDLPKSTLSFEKNGISVGVCYDDIVRKDNVHYRMAVGVYAKETIEIIDYSESDVND